MPSGTLYLRVDAGKGLALRGVPAQSLFCVLGVGSTRYRGQPASPDQPHWNENFRFEVSSEPVLAVEVWITTAVQEEQLLGSASIPMSQVTVEQDRMMDAQLRNSQGAEVGVLQIFHAFRPSSGGSQAYETAPKPVVPDPVFSNPYAISLGAAGSSQQPGDLYPTPPTASAFSLPYDGATPTYSSAPPVSQQPSYPPAYPPPVDTQQPGSIGSAPHASKVSHGASYYEPPGVPAGYTGASSSSNLPPAGYPAPSPGAPPGQFYAGKPAKFGAPSKYSGMGGVGAGVAAGAVSGIAAAALLGGLGRPHRFGFKHKGFGFKGPKGFGFKGPKGFGFGKGFGFKGPKGFGFGKGFGWKD